MPRDRTKTESWSNPYVIGEILNRSRSVAVMGLSDKPERPSFGVARALIENGYRVIGVNPSLEEVLGAICYPTLSDIPERIDAVNVFWKPAAVDSLVDEVIELRIPYLWLQEGVVNIEAAEKALNAGIKVVMDRCMAKELARRPV
jgi:predicted CoA-binding protein